MPQDFLNGADCLSVRLGDEIEAGCTTSFGFYLFRFRKQRSLGVDSPIECSPQQAVGITLALHFQAISLLSNNLSSKNDFKGVEFVLSRFSQKMEAEAV